MEKLRMKKSVQEVKESLAKRNLLGKLLMLAKECHVDPEELIEGRRFQSVVTARRRFIQMLTVDLGFSASEIGAILGCDSTSVRNALGALSSRKRDLASAAE